MVVELIHRFFKLMEVALQGCVHCGVVGWAKRYLQKYQRMKNLQDLVTFHFAVNIMMLISHDENSGICGP